MSVFANDLADGLGKPFVLSELVADIRCAVLVVPCVMQRLVGIEVVPYVSRQLGHKDSSITLKVYAHWIPDASTVRAVDLLDETRPSATQAQPAAAVGEWRTAVSPYGRMVSLNFPSWNQLDGWLRQVDGLRRVA
jgi:hypothetical protein